MKLIRGLLVLLIFTNFVFLTTKASGQDLCCSPDAGAQCGMGPPSPVIIDLSGARFELTSVADGVIFDIFASGRLVRTSWTSADARNGFLVLDRNHNGVVDDGSELFGNFTAQSPSETPNGYLALQMFDDPAKGGNGDGLIDSRDQVYDSLKIWLDANHNGASEANELMTLEQASVVSISLDFRTDMRTDEFGNRFQYRAKVFLKDGNSRWSYDVFFKTLDLFQM